ncbi:hypothetical protein NP233_g8452 [Leucocoprinus birnbaumii]|uniref:Tat pathway signal sequence n=1 Tax=Leucocoprinus birnbaumii TaxID=56174 RepID=A0AAD5YTR3_9AGAR|nr:hypothetical protein NP233_g8452 [Leucocoprinus birnbaumii]
MSPSVAYEFQALPNDDEIEDHKVEGGNPHRRRQPKKFSCVLLILLVTSVIFNVISMAFWLRFPKQGYSYYPQLTETPAEIAVAYEVTRFGAAKELLFEQDRSPHVDAAWRNLYDFSGSTLPGNNNTPTMSEIRDFMKQQGTKIQLLDIFHQLHCLDTIRKAYYPQDYDEQIIVSSHVIHCINAIRQSLMCMVDVSKVSWVWDEQTDALVESQSNFHTCRDFEKIKQWALENHYDRQFVVVPQQR